MIPEGFLNVSFVHSMNGVSRPAIWSMGFAYVDFAGTVLDAVLEIQDAYNDHTLKDLSSSLTNHTTLWKVGPDSTGLSGSIVGGGAGTASGEAPSPQTAFLVRKNTNQGGRRGRGRFFLPGVSEGAMAQGGLLNPGSQTGIQANLTLMYNRWITADLLPVVFHGPDVPSDVAPSFVTGLALQSRVATQRRRNRK